MVSKKKTKLTPTDIAFTAFDRRMTSWGSEYPFESHYLEVRPGQVMHYIDEGPRDGGAGTLVMFHGNPTWSFMYRNIIKEFRGRYRCIAFDHIGCGLSSKPPLTRYPYRLRDRIDDAAALLDELEVSHATFLLHDWGGAIGMGVAMENPTILQRLVVFNTAAFRSSQIPFSINLCKIPLLGASLILGFNAFARVAQWRATANPELLPPTTRDAYLAPYNTYANRIATLKFVHDIPMTPNHPSYATLRDIEESLIQFKKLPTLIIWGDADFCFNEDFREEWKKRFPSAICYHYPDAGHYIIEDKQEEILEILEGWLPESDSTH